MHLLTIFVGVRILLALLEGDVVVLGLLRRLAGG
jgi:hypothetical protein